MPSIEAISLVKTAIKSHPRKIAGVADEIGYSRTALSLYVNGIYKRNPRNLEVAILERYQGPRTCPHDGEEVPVAVCRKRAYAPEPYGGNARHAAWRACQTCPNKPQEP